MRRTLAFLAFTLAVTSYMSALDQTFIEPSAPVSLAIKGMGGASTANATGTDALFTNPASFADPNPTLTILSFEGTANIPLGSLSDIVAKRDSWTNMNLMDATNPMTDLVNNLLTQSTIGAETSLVSGWVGNNLGVGLSIQARSSANGRTITGTTVKIDTTVQGVVGMAWPFDVGMGTLRIGGDLRPLQRTFASVSYTDFVAHKMNLDAYPVLSGFGMGWDMGARWDYLGFKTGLVIRDVGSTVINFQSFSAKQWMTAFGFPLSGTTTSDSTIYRLPTVIGLGTTWSPDLGSLGNIIQPSVALDFQIPIQDSDTQPSFWTWTHVGGDIRLLQMLTLRAGLNQGYFTFGLGTKVLFMEFNMAVYTDELGRYSSQSPRSAVAFQWAFSI